MKFDFPENGEKLGSERVEFLRNFKISCRRTILEMCKNSQSGHPGGSLSNLDFLAVLYAFRLTKTDEKIVISNGHISPAVYSVLAECGVADREEVVATFRKFGSKFEGHVCRHAPGIWFGTGPLGCGVSVAAGFALAEKKNGKKMVFATVGDGEMQEGQIHETAIFANHAKLDNLCVFVDWNRVQLTDSLKKTMSIDPTAFFSSKNWNVIEIDGHDDEAIWSAIGEAEASDRPTAIIGKTVMGNGVPMMQEDGENLIPTWHGKTPKPDEVDAELLKPELIVKNPEILEKFRVARNFRSKTPDFVDFLKKNRQIDEGEPILYLADELTDCRSAYGKALLDLAERNPQILASTADVSGSVMTKFVAAKLPEQFIEFGICEQNMVSACGGLSLADFVPFCSTFGAFLSSRAKDQARMNDLNRTNVKMVATHCGLSVGEDGPTHQAIDDAGSFLGMFNTGVCEPADPNHCDRIIRFVASRWGNFYVRMGRAKLPVLLDERGEPFFGKNYVYEYGKCDILKKGEKCTIVAIGATVHEAKKAVENSGADAEIVIASSIKKFDENLKKSIQKTRRVVVCEDHCSKSGLGAGVALFCAENGLKFDFFRSVAVEKYQLSGKPDELYEASGIDASGIEAVLEDACEKA